MTQTESPATVLTAEEHDPTVDRSTLSTATGFLHNQQISYQLIGETAVFQGDIILDRKKIKQARNPKEIEAAIRPKQWPGGKIPYTFDPSWGSNLAKARDAAKKAMDAWLATNAEIQFSPKAPNDVNWINFFPSNGGYSSQVGVIDEPGPQDVNFPSANILYMKVAHELGHVLGFWHEQSRQDRDTYITINIANVISGTEHNFDKYQLGDGKDVGAYDFHSIMHYSQYAFSNDPDTPTITPKPGFANQAGNMGQREHLSAGDIAAVKRIYR
jgi:hypothetical protein